MFGDHPVIPQDWDSIYNRGIYPIYRKGDIGVKNELEKALYQMFDIEKEDELYLTILIWSHNLHDSICKMYNRAPFCLDSEILIKKQGQQ